jgi:pimeloyl-ACP methyl ester carboxylesterase
LWIKHLVSDLRNPADPGVTARAGERAMRGGEPVGWRNAGFNRMNRTAVEEARMSIDLIALPGGVMPAALRYQWLAATLEGEVCLNTKVLEAYSGDIPPSGYSITLEVEALSSFADSLNLDRFHPLGYSGGGFVSLAFAGAHP